MGDMNQGMFENQRKGIFSIAHSLNSYFVKGRIEVYM